MVVHVRSTHAITQHQPRAPATRRYARAATPLARHMPTMWHAGHASGHAAAHASWLPPHTHATHTHMPHYTHTAITLLAYSTCAVGKSYCQSLIRNTYGTHTSTRTHIATPPHTLASANARGHLLLARQLRHGAPRHSGHTPAPRHTVPHTLIRFSRHTHKYVAATLLTRVVTYTVRVISHISLLLYTHNGTQALHTQ